VCVAASRGFGGNVISQTGGFKDLCSISISADHLHDLGIPQSPDGKIRIVTSTPLSFPLPRIVNAPTTVSSASRC
jgi:hypothetical protein